jgi:outer membrane protein assembly factor BamB
MRSSSLVVRLLAFATMLWPALVSAASAPSAPAWSPEDFVTVSGPASPRVAFAVQRSGDRLDLAVEVASFTDDGSGTSVQVGVAAAKTVMLSDREAQVTRGRRTARYAFALPASTLVDGEADWRTLRLGLAVAWGGGPGGAERQRERLRHRGGSAHEGLSPQAGDWLPFDLVEHATQVADRKNRVVVPIDQPMDGKATVVIEDAQGHRLRNLIGGQPMAKGRHEIEWDGLDDRGNLLAPGTYRWRSIHHPGIAPEYLMTYGNGDNEPKDFGGWGPNHTTLVEATATAAWTLVASAMTEGGDSLLLLDERGHKKLGMNVPMGMGMWKIAPAIDGDTLYIANDGQAWGDHFNPEDPKAVTRLKITIARYNLAEGRLVEYAGKRFVELLAVEVGPGAADKDWRSVSLTGMAVLGGKLYIGNRRTNSLLVVDAAKGEKVGELPLPAPGALTAVGGKLYAVSAGAVVIIDPATGMTTTVVAAGVQAPVGLAVDAQGAIYLSDAKTHTIRAFSPQGKPLYELGKPGGPYVGPYDPERLVHPSGIAVAANGWLWVTENNENPKRVSAFDLATRKVVVEKFGTPAYGGSGAGFDTADQTRWLGLGVQWRLDLAKGTAVPTHVLGATVRPTHYRYLHEGDRTYVIGLHGATGIDLQNADGSLRPVAVIGSTHRFSMDHEWHPPQAFIDAFAKAYPNRAGKHADKGPGFLWCDANGDGKMQVEEFDFATSAEDFAGGYWGNDFSDLTLRVPVAVKGDKRVLVTLKPTAIDAKGTPSYPRLDQAIAAGVPLALEGSQVETFTDRFGDIVCNTDPEMRCFAPDGALRWTYPNRWSNVHGSHNAPLPELGVMQGVLFSMGTAPLDERADVFVLVGNHGRYFAMTSDGLYLDEFFKDVRMGVRADAYLIGGEAFGGCFGRSAKDSNYYLQANGYRVYRVRGLDQVKRAEGALTFTPAQAVAAERNQAKRQATVSTAKVAAIVHLAKAPTIDGKGDDWSEPPLAKWDKSGRFPVSVRAGIDERNLYLLYEVADDSPWVNNGKDWTLLFKTGDSIDLQLGTDATANPLRSGPVPGDLRLLIAPFQGKDIAVLYRHRLPGAREPMTFTCPWRSEKVDAVTRLDQARIAVTKDGGRYRVEAAIALADLGLAPGGAALKADFGVIFGDPDGRMNMLRSYWANQSTGLVNDVPGEIMLFPSLWGTVGFGGKP